nr:LacI family DNA-binding transcriptional regulator [Arthrobacter sp. 35W]
MTKTPATRPTATRADVARHAGVSSAVVSYVVNNGPRPVAPATRERVLAAIAALGYRPNAAARALRLGSAEMIGLVIPDNRNPFINELAHAVEVAAAARGHVMVLANSDGSAAIEEAQLRNLAARQVDGLLLISVGATVDPAALASLEVPVVLLDRGSGTEGFGSVGTDLYAGAVAGVEHLLGHGHQNIGLAIGVASDGRLDGRERGFRDALAAASLPPGPVVRAAFTRDGGYRAGRQLLAGGRPTAVFASSDMQAVGMLHAFHEAGVRVPDDIAVVSFDGSPEAEFCWPPLTTLAQPVAAMAEAAVDALLGGPSAEPRHHAFDAQLVIRRSCGCA